MKIKEVEDSGQVNAIVMKETIVDVRDMNPDGSLGDITESFTVKEIEKYGQELYEFEVAENLTVTFREMTGRDQLALQKLGGKATNLEILYAMIVRLCVQWGDRDGVTQEYFLNMPHRKLRPIQRRLEAFVSHFFRD